MTLDRELDLPADLVFGRPEVESRQADTPPSYVTKLIDHQVVRDKLMEAHDRHKRAYDIKEFQNNYKAGDLVLLFAPAVKKGRNKKWSSRWTGPYQIVEVLSDVVLRIQLNNKIKDRVVHHNRLKPYYQ